jgi:hypothetical protein
MLRCVIKDGALMADSFAIGETEHGRSRKLMVKPEAEGGQCE